MNKHIVVEEVNKTNENPRDFNYKFRHGKLKVGKILYEKIEKNGDVMLVTPFLKRYVCRVNSALYNEKIKPLTR